MEIMHVEGDVTRIIIPGGIVGVDREAKVDLEFCTVYRAGDAITCLHICANHNVQILWPKREWQK